MSRRHARSHGARPRPDHPVILFDGVCGLCNRWVDFVLRRDDEARFRFAALQSDAGRRALRRAGLPPDFAASIVLVDADGVWMRSAAALRILRGLGAPYAWLYALVLVPRPVRDAVYRWIARNRYDWFGRRAECRLPSPAERERFL